MDERSERELMERARAFFTFEYMSKTPIEQRIKDITAALQSEREAAAAKARRAAIEECAQYAENRYHETPYMVAKGIRALASPAPQEETR